MTNLDKTREQLIFELVLSLNNGNTGYTNDRVKTAICQFEQLVGEGIIKPQKG